MDNDAHVSGLCQFPNIMLLALLTTSEESSVSFPITISLENKKNHLEERDSLGH